VSHVEYTLTGQTDRETDGRQTVTVRLPLDAASVMRQKTQDQCALQAYVK